MTPIRLPGAATSRSTHGGKHVEIVNVKKTVTIHSVEDQDRLRREEMRHLSPSERITALLHYRDRAFQPQPMKKQIRIRHVPIG